MQKTTALKENRDFRRLYKKGRNVVNAYLVLYYSKNRLGANRMGITTSKKIGTAVMRNRARRVIREAYRKNEEAVCGGYDFVFVARGRTVSIKSDELARILRGMLKNAGVMRNETIAPRGN